MIIRFVHEGPQADSEAGFTLLEALVALLLVSVVMSIAVGHILFIHETYFKDLERTQVNSNLRSALDILSMNIRQAGENLQSSFPAVVVDDGGTGVPDVLRLRRNRLTAVLTLCQDISAGETDIPVSRSDLSVSACVNANVLSSYTAFESLLADDGGTSTVYVYDRVNNVGEFLEFSGTNISLDQKYLNTSATTNDYPALTTAIYMLEEFRFEVNQTDNLLVLERDGDTTEELTVAFEVTNLSVQLVMDDGVYLDELLPDDSTYDWKNIRKVAVELSSQSTWKGSTFELTLSGQYFPRNVLSYDG